MFILPHIFSLISTNLQSSICHCSSPFLKLPFHLLSRRSSTYGVSLCVCRRHMKICITATWASEGLHDISCSLNMSSKMTLSSAQSDVEAVADASICGDTCTIFADWLMSTADQSMSRMSPQLHLTTVAANTNTYLLDKFTVITCHYLCSFKAQKNYYKMFTRNN